MKESKAIDRTKMRPRRIWAGFLSVTALFPIVFAQTTQPFPDVPKNHWAYSAVMDLKQKGILLGYPESDAQEKSHKLSYNLSSPLNAWRSLLLAMRRRDEEGVKYITSETFFDTADVDFNHEWQLNYGITTRKQWLDYYEERAKHWTKLNICLSFWGGGRYIFPGQDVHMYSKQEEAQLVARASKEARTLEEAWIDLLPRNIAEQPMLGTGTIVRLKRENDEWKIISLGQDIE